VGITRLQAAGTLALAALLAASLAWAVYVSPAISFVRQDREALWIARAEPVSMRATAALLERLPAVEFSKRFRLDAGSALLRVRVEALRGFELELNGRRVGERAWHEGSWKRASEFELAEGLVAGENELRVRVRNPLGPPLLRLEAQGEGLRLASDASWTTRREGAAELPARRASDRLRPAEVSATPRLGEGLVEKRSALLGAFAAGALVSVWLRGPRADRLRGRASLVWLPILSLWLFVFAFRAVRLPEYVGYDGPDHLAYVHAIVRGSLPLANEGAQTYHPPLFYAVSAALLALFPAPGFSARIVLRVVPFAAGLVQVGVAWALARRLFPAQPSRAALAALCAALFPVNLYMSAYLGNEPLHAALAALALLLATHCLLARDAPPRQLVLLGVLLGLAILTKVSSLLLVPFAAGFLAAKEWLCDGRRPVSACLRAALVVASVSVVCGWFFVRNELRLGQAVVGNWNVPGSPSAWWQAPGFHTPSYYLSFGPGLGRPFFAGLESFWDGFYSTFWGDGFAAGVAAWSYRHPLWDYGFMGATYALALPATALLLFGFVRLVAVALRGPDLRRRAALSFLTTVCAVSVYVVPYMTLVHPVYSMTKASYALSVAAVLALALAEGLGAVHRALDAPGRRGLQLVFHGWAGALAGAIVLSFSG
jgi:hypothetical protein